MRQNVWIVGANGAIGFELVKIYLKNGFKVVASSRDIENLKDFLNLKSEYKTNLKLLNIDVLDEKLPQLNKYLGPFRILCQLGKIKNTKGHKDENRNRCRAIC